MAEWESDEPELPEALAAHLAWQDDVTVYFCYEKYNVLETKWSVFKRHWKNFLFTMMARFCLAAGVKKRSGSVAKAK